MENKSPLVTEAGTSRNRLKTLLGVALVLIVFVEFFSPMLFQGKTFFTRDFSVITYPFKSFLAQAYHQGVIPYWTPSIYGGTPFMAALHPGVFYPPSIFYFMDDVTTALNLFYLFHFLLLALSVYFLVKSWRLSNTAALCASLTSMLSGFFLGSSLLSNFFLGAVWFPLVFLLFQKFLFTRKNGYLVLAIFALACQTLAACPEVCILTVLLIGAHSLFILPEENTALPGWRARSIALGVMVVMALTLCALQLVPTYELVKFSGRSGGLPYAVHTAWSMAPQKLASFILPNTLEGMLDGMEDFGLAGGFLQNLYLGIFAPVFVLLAFYFRKDRNIRFWLLVFFAGIFLSMGKYNPMYEFFYPWVPLLDMFRFPEKYFYISALAVIFLVAHCLDTLVRRTEERTINIRVVLSTVIFVCALVVLFSILDKRLDPFLSFFFLFLFGFIYLMFYFRKLDSNWLRSLFLVLLVMDLVLLNFRQLPLIDKAFYEREPLLLGTIKKDPDPYRIYTGEIHKEPKKLFLPMAASRVSSWRAMKEMLYPYMGMIYGVDHVDALPALALELSDHELINKLITKSPPQKRFRILKRGNVKYWIDKDSPMSYRGGQPVILPDRLKIFDDALPRAYLVPKMRMGKFRVLLNTYYEESFDPRAEVLLNEPVEFKESAEFSGEVEGIAYRPNHVTVKTRQVGNGFLVLMDSYFPGWTLTVDGETRSILRANHFYRAVQLEPGSHVLEFDYYPEGFNTGLAISGVTSLILIGILLYRPASVPLDPNS